MYNTIDQLIKLEAKAIDLELLLQGAVSVRFFLHGTSFCFVCCHLASGSKDGDVLLRNVDAADILSRTRFRRCRTAAPDEELPSKILDHE
jgi:phosphatidylinositol-bisphosphatase